jgi:L-ascorbate metabolism protein UlaG (beta-lactamase superfamily)
MRITKFGHACVRVESGDQVLVIDPGSWTEPESVDGASAVLVTHEHPDHLSFDNLRAADARIFTIAAVQEQIAAQAPDLSERVVTIAPGERFDAGLPVTAVGELHAVIHPEIERCYNSGYIVEAEGSAIYHPGDAFTAPGREIDLLLLPVHAPWSKVSEVIDFARSVGAPTSVAVHDGLLGENGLKVVGGLLTGMLEQHELAYRRVPPGEEIELR